eukprot:202683-Rhodomonas_salina.2
MGQCSMSELGSSLTWCARRGARDGSGGSSACGLVLSTNRCCMAGTLSSDSSEAPSDVASSCWRSISEGPLEKPLMALLTGLHSSDGRGPPLPMDIKGGGGRLSVDSTDGVMSGSSGTGPSMSSSSGCMLDTFGSSGMASRSSIAAASY